MATAAPASPNAILKITYRVFGITRTLFLYRIAQFVSFPFVVLYLLARLFTSRGYWSHFGERLGFLPRCFDGTTPGSIWLHAVSAGEIASAVPLIQTLRTELPHAPFYLSTSTIAGRNAAERRLGSLVDGIFYCPFDYISCIRPVLRTLHPSLVIVLETEIWPNLYAETKRSGACLAIVNGRISDRTWPRYQAFQWFFKPILQLADIVVAQSSVDATRYRAIGVSEARLHQEGNLKYDASSVAPPSRLPTFGAKHIWIAASTVGPNEAGSVQRHSVDEDDIVLNAFGMLSSEFPHLLLILAPRQPARFDIVGEKLKARGIHFARRTNQPLDLPLPAVLLLDTMGELSGSYSLANVAFVGGSLAPRGGHNILEPAAAGVPVVVGPHMQNFQAIAREFLDAKAIVQIQSSEQLAPAIRELLVNPDRAQELGRRARSIIHQQQGVADRIAARLLPLYYSANPGKLRSLLSRLFLRPLTLLWERGGIAKRHKSLQKAGSLPVPVISIGGITVGGSGKTPFVNYLATRLRQSGHLPAILTRGYRRRSPAKYLIFAPGAHVPPAMTGDEAQILLRAGQASIGIGSNRYETGKLLLREFPETDVCLLDDGFQHALLHRDADIVLIDGLDPFGQGELVPLGRLREPLTALRRAHAFVVTRTENDRRYEAIRNELRRMNPDTPIFRTRLVAHHWRIYGTGELVPALAARRVAAFCGLGNPQSFWNTLESLDLDIVFRWDFPDHHSYRPAELQRIAHQARLHGAEILVTTEKDVINCPGHCEHMIAPFNLAWLEIELTMDEEEEFLDLVGGKLTTPPGVVLERKLRGPAASSSNQGRP
jgi:tetraacyldisaccharide 4'-kinase